MEKSYLKLKIIILNTKVVFDLLTNKPNYCHTIRFMAFLVLNHSDIVTKNHINMLPKYSTHTTSLTKLQCAVLLSMTFFNMLPNYPDFSFDHIKQNDPEKLKAIMNYYIGIERIFSKDPDYLLYLQVRFCRNQGSRNIINEINNNKSVVNSNVRFDTMHKIEDIPGIPQAVFANKKIGGGVLTDGSVQEEIRYLICPECLLVVLLCNNETLEDTESVSINGAERFSNYTGYGRTSFKISDRPVTDITTRRVSGDNILDVKIIAFDAKKYNTTGTTQYGFGDIQREIIKLSSVFSTLVKNKQHSFVTGHWGCGAFHGNKMVKFFIQYLVAAHYGIDLIYCTSEDNKFNKQIIQDFINKSRSNTISEFYNYFLVNAIDLQKYS